MKELSSVKNFEEFKANKEIESNKYLVIYKEKDTNIYSLAYKHKPTKKQTVIGMVNTKDFNTVASKKAVWMEIKAQIKAFEVKYQPCCYTTAKKAFGGDFVDKIGPTHTCDNPYHKKATQMKLYHIDWLAYNLNCSMDEVVSTLSKYRK